MDTKEWSNKFLAELGRNYYVTPTSYIELINQFTALIKKKQEEIRNIFEKYENGYQQIIEAEESVGGLQVKLTALVPNLEIAAKKTEEVLKEVEVNKADADVLKAKVQVDKDFVEEKQQKANAIKEDCENDLAEVMPELEKANALYLLLSFPSIVFVLKK